MSKYSIIIPTTGRASLINVLRALENNFLGLSCQKNIPEIILEVLIVFDGVSALNFERVIRSEKFSFDLKVLETQVKEYAGGARNLALGKASGEILIFLGDDTLPQPGWLKSILTFHTQNSASREALLGTVVWSGKSKKDSFHKWLRRHGQFEFGKLERGQTPDWKHFYTANISLKKTLLEKSPGTIRFNPQFLGWGFEDSEFGYQCFLNGMKLKYNSQCIVSRDRLQTLDQLVERTKNARRNAEIFENIHPEVKIIPRGLKLFILRSAMRMAVFLGKFNQKFYWWSEWKKAWISEEK